MRSLRTGAFARRLFIKVICRACELLLLSKIFYVEIGRCISAELDFGPWLMRALNLKGDSIIAFSCDRKVVPLQKRGLFSRRKLRPKPVGCCNK